MAERWRWIVGYEGYYEVSSAGRVRSVDRVATDGSRRRGQLRKLVPIYREGQKYLTVVLSRGSEVKCVRVHIEVLNAFRGSRATGQETRHLDGDGSNNRLSNLRWGTPRQNADDKQRHGSVPRGTRHWNARLTVRRVGAIRRALRRGERQRAVARRYGICQQQVSRIATGLRWVM